MNWRMERKNIQISKHANIDPPISAKLSPRWRMVTATWGDQSAEQESAYEWSKAWTGRKKMLCTVVYIHCDHE
jgi:hypothetical protein